jgi:hypothetical protein
MVYSDGELEIGTGNDIVFNYFFLISNRALKRKIILVENPIVEGFSSIVEFTGGTPKNCLSCEVIYFYVCYLLTFFVFKKKT